jgi:hypothetical protein
MYIQSSERHYDSILPPLRDRKEHEGGCINGRENRKGNGKIGQGRFFSGWPLASETHLLTR